MRYVAPGPGLERPPRTPRAAAAARNRRAGVAVAAWTALVVALIGGGVCLGGRPVETMPVRVEFPPGWRVPPERIEVHDEDGERVAGAWWQADPCAADEAASRTIRVPRLAAGSYEFVVEPMGWHEVVAVAADAQSVTLRVGPPATVVVRAVDPGGAPIGTDVRVLWGVPGITTRGMGLSEARVESGDGTHRFQAPQGPVSVVVTARGRVEQTLSLLLAGLPTSSHTVTLPLGATLRVSLVDDGVPAPDADGRVTLRTVLPSGTEWSLSARTRAGAVEFDGLPPARYQVFAGDEPVFVWSRGKAEWVTLAADDRKEVIVEAR